MKIIADQYHGDPLFAQLQTIMRDVPAAREMLKTASFTKEAADLLPSGAFAWEAERRFPVHTKEDTVASILYRSKVAGYVPIEVDTKLATAAKIYGIDVAVFNSTKIAAETEVTYALPEIKRLPLDTDAQIKVAEEVLCRDFTRLPTEMRADAFSRLVKAAGAHNLELRELTYKLGGLTVCDKAQLCDWLEARATAAPGEVQKVAFQKLADGLRKADEVISNRKDLVKVASAIYELDKQAGFEKFYDKKLPDPMLTVFNTTKVAEDMCDVAGKKVACAKLMGLPDSVWDQVDMPELAKIAESGDLSEFKLAFATVPLDIKVVLRSYV
jgi:hypothetical protein